MAGFRSYVWDPLLILSQIVAMQCQFYVFLCTYVMVLTAIAHVQPTLTHILSSKLTASWHHGWPVIISYSLSSISGAFSLRYVVRRSKKCMDFTVTLFLVHVLLCTVTKGLPTCWQWWLLNVLTAGVMVVLGEWLCLRQEVSEIPLSVGASNSASNKQSSK